MKITTENGVKYEDIENLESLLIDGKTFIVEDVHIRISSNYFINILNKNNISFSIAHFSVILKRILLTSMVFISLFIAFMCSSAFFHELTHGNKKIAYLLNENTAHNSSNPLFFKEVFSKKTYRIHEDALAHYYAEGSNLTGNNILSWICPEYGICFTYSDTIYSIDSNDFKMYSFFMSLFLTSVFSYVITRKYIFIKVEYFIIKNMFSNTVELVYKGYKSSKK